ncbi:MAG: acetoacetate--CoA ligase [Alphaproteobacteria bacterium]|nr:acetoacetate--CoA ligase [Alphaproteobacteria bacterium]
MNSPLWRPSAEKIASTNLTAFTRLLKDRMGLALEDYRALHRFSVENMEAFWAAVWEFCGVVAPYRGGPVLLHGTRMPGARFFPEAHLNFAENLLRRRDDGAAIIFRAEDKVARSLTWRELYAAAARMAAALRRAGVKPGDRCAGFMPNAPEAVIAMLGTAAIGAVWTSCSPDFGAQGVLDRFGQVEPKILFACDGYYYNGKWISTLERMAAVAEKLPSVERVVLFSIGGAAPAATGPTAATAVRDAVRWEDFLAPDAPGDIGFEHLPFAHPLYILYSSGTTGAPKCIVHSAGGTLLKHLEEQRLQCDIKRDDRVFYFTTCGWMMWNWLVSALASEATLVLYDGSPFAPNANVLFDFADDAGITFFGTSAKYIDALANQKLEPKNTHDLSTIRAIASTGSPLAPESFDYVYRSIKEDVCLASIAGGTDIVGCFVGGNPNSPVWRGEIQGPMLGMSVDVFSDAGESLPDGKGELVCTRPFPSMPAGFWKDHDGARYRAAYFERFPDVWCHGDFVAWTEHGGIVIYGRSDATLNPGGVRIGTAEIYRQVEAFEEVEEALCIGQQWQRDTRIILFVRMRPGATLGQDLIGRIRKRVRESCSPRHVPAKVIAVADIPRTKSGKITELAVRDVVEGRPVKNKEALANPEALDLFAGLAELQQP